MQDTTFYLLNGVALVLVQLVVRLLNWPVVIIIYTAQYHNWDFVSAFNRVYNMCIVCTTVWQVLEIYWFWMIIQLVAGYKKKSDKTE